MVNTMRRTTMIITGLSMVSLLLSGCSQTVHMEPAKYAESPDCAEVTVRVPDTLAGEERRWTDAQATAAWGSPASILLRCGVIPQGPSELPCYELGGVDWLALEQEEDLQRAVTFGRDPAVEVVVSRSANLDFADVLDSVGSFVSVALPDTTGQCTSRVTAPAS